MPTCRCRLLWILAVVCASLLLSAATARAGTPFVRGDADANGVVQVSDGVRTLIFLFGGEALRPITCLSALDTDDSGGVTLTDAVAILLHLFQGGRSPAPPYPGCGVDTSNDNLSCELHAPCDDPRAEGGDTSGLDRRPPAGDCVAPSRPPSRADVRLERVYPSLSLIGILGLSRRPGDSTEWYALRKPGYLYRFADVAGVSARTTVLDLTDRVTSTSEGGLLSFAFHPRFQQNGLGYAFYTHQAGDRLVGRVVRFRSPNGGETFDRATEVILLEIEQPTVYHFGGTVAFGKDGYLYVGLGDGGLKAEAQNLDSLRGKILRLDVDQGPLYGIPPDNPLARGGGRAEIFAWGFRNPWRFTFDRSTGALWAGDVGDDEWEEIHQVEMGRHHGWPVREGAHCYRAADCETAGLVEPVLDYNHATDGSCVIGGYVYRGTLIPGFQGTYVYGDWGNGRIWGLGPGERTPRLLVESGLRILSFAEDASGELFVLSGDKIHRLVASGGGDPGREFPALLSLTGLVEPQQPSQPKPCFVPYDINTPFWSDGAEKQRWLFVPEGKQISLLADGDWDLPVGSVLLKQFEKDGRVFETRILIRHEDGDWAGYTYEWNDAGTDAVLLTDEKTRLVADSPWSFPSRAQCLQCHTESAGRTLGLETAQLNRAIKYPLTGRVANQLVTLQRIGLIEPLGSGPLGLPALANPLDTRRPLADRARSYLHSNCSHCHRPDGGGRGSADLRFTIGDGALGICNVPPLAGDLGTANARLLVPGDPEKSLIALRMHSTPGKMPPIGRNQVDAAGATLIQAWIRAQESCQLEPVEIVLDDGGPGTSQVGAWSPSNAAGFFGTGSVFSRGQGSYSFEAELPRPGRYAVDLWWTQWPSRRTDVPVEIEHRGGIRALTVDQLSAGGRWNRLGEFDFTSRGVVTVRSLGGDSTCADAVRFVAVE